eukprot:Em0012g902a
MAGQSGFSEPTLPERQALTTVLRFLKKKNLKDTEEMLRKELGVHSDAELDEFNSLGGMQHSRETEPSKYDESYSSPLPILASRPPPLTKATNWPAPLASTPRSHQSNGSLPVPMAAAASPQSPPSSSPSSHYAGTVGINKGIPHSTDEGMEECAKSSLLLGRPYPPILALPATSGGTSGSMLSVPPFLYQLAASCHPYQAGLVPTAATSASALTHHPSMIASVCTLRPSGLVSTSAFPFANPMGATYGVLIGTSSKKSPPPAVEDNEASPATTSSPLPTVARSPKVDAPVVSSTQPHLHDGSVPRPFTLKGSAQVLAAIPPEEYTPALVELKQFAEEFKTRRIRLGYTQGAVGQSLADRGYSNFAQSTISRFEQLQLSPTNAAAIKQILEKWLQEAESPLSSIGTCVGGDAEGANGCRKRKKRAVFTPQTKALLEDHFALNPRPNRTTIEMLSGKLDLLPEEIRVWFCNKRQKAKQSGSDDGANATTPSSNGSNGRWGSGKVWSTSSVGSVGSRSASPFQVGCVDARCSGGSPSPKTSFTIEELSKSSVMTTPSGSSGTPSPSLSSPPLVFSPYDVSPTLAAVASSSQSLLDFVEKSLDLYRPELSLLVYPVFVHLYLDLVMGGLSDAAQHFFAKFQGKQETIYDDELTRLRSTTTPQQLVRSELFESFKKNKFTVRMCKDSLQCLVKHLQVHQHTLILNIINQYLNLDVFDGTPRTHIDIRKTLGAMDGEASSTANKAKILYGIPKDPDIIAALAELEEEENEVVAEDDKPKKKKLKKETLAGKKGKLSSAPNAPPVTRVPMPPLRDCEQAAKFVAFKESAKCITLGPTNLPSVCFYTILNSFGSLTAVSIADNSALLAGSFSDSIVRIWTLTPKKLCPLKQPNQLQQVTFAAEDVLERILDTSCSMEIQQLVGHSGPVYSTSFNPDNTFLVSGSEDGTVRLWSLQTFTALVCFKGHNYPVWSVEFSPYGFYFISASHDRTVRLWSTDHNQPLRILAGHLSDVDCCKFHPNGNYVASGSSDRSVRIWDIVTGMCVRVFTGHKGSIQALAFSPDGRFLASSGTDHRILIWSVGTALQVCELRGHMDAVYQLAFSRDGNVLASGGLDNCVKLWDTAGLEEEGIKLAQTSQECLLGSYATKQTSVHCLHFTRKNLLLASGPYNS